MDVLEKWKYYIGEVILLAVAAIYIFKLKNFDDMAAKNNNGQGLLNQILNNISSDGLISYALGGVLLIVAFIGISYLIIKSDQNGYFRIISVILNLILLLVVILLLLNPIVTTFICIALIGALILYIMNN